MPTPPPTLHLFTGSNGAGKTTFARAYLRQLAPIPRFLNADEIARAAITLVNRSVRRGSAVSLRLHAQEMRKRRRKKKPAGHDLARSFLVPCSCGLSQTALPSTHFHRS